jgi:imidazolonepropionase-like amidohydrolase
MRVGITFSVACLLVLAGGIVPLAEWKVPPGAEVLDVKGQYALPGLINFHEHRATPS